MESFNWRDRKDGVDDVFADDLNEVAHAAAENREVLIKSVLKPMYIWFANLDAVASLQSPFVKIGTLASTRAVNVMYIVMAATSVAGSVIIPNLTATTVDASVSAGNYSKFHPGDLLMYGGVYGTTHLWRWIPQAEAKEDRDGLESAWDKQQINKVPGLVSNVSTLQTSVANMPKEITFHTEDALLNWISVDGVHYVKAEEGNQANPGYDIEGLSYIVHAGREFDGTKFTGRRFQLAQQLKTNRWFYRVGNVNSGGSFNGIAWIEITS